MVDMVSTWCEVPLSVMKLRFAVFDGLNAFCHDALK